jgi:hypothetical protein
VSPFFLSHGYYVEPFAFEIEEILRARIRKVGRGSRREALIKWIVYVRPIWESLSSLEDIVVLDTFEKRYGPATVNDGYSYREGR